MSDIADTTTATPEATAAATEMLKSGQYNINDATYTADAPEADAQAAEPTEADKAAEAQKAADAEAAKKVADAEAAKKTEESKYASKFAALSRKEKEIRQREKALEARMKQVDEQVKAKETELTGKLIDPVEFKKNPLKVMEQTGLTFQELAEMVLNNGKPTPEMLIAQSEKAALSKIEALEAKIAEKEKAETEQKLHQQINAFKGQIADYIKNNTTDYELVQANNALDLVYEVIEAHHANTAAQSEDGTGEILDFKTAADAVESHLLEEAKKVLSVSKLKSFLQAEPKQTDAPAAPKPTSADATKTAPKTGAKTLSNANSVAAPNTKRKLSAEESVTEAAKMLKWIE